MTENSEPKRHVAVIGAGPAGMFAARTLAQAGLQVALINRDIKPGGLAEYGIYPDKHTMKNGLRNQFRKIMEEPNIAYLGNLAVGVEGGLRLEDLIQAGFDAILVTVGAQGTKWLGLPGEELQGVYHAKDLVYHYNQLPPFSEMSFPIGRRVALIGVGNVMLDIAHWTIRGLKVEEVIAVARRGPAEVKFSQKEFEIICANLDLPAFEAEFERCRPVMEAVGQDLEDARAFILKPLEKAYEPVSSTRFRFDFLASPSRILGDDSGRVTGLEIEDTVLVARDGGDTKAQKTGTKRVLDVDSVVFCIGDRVDDKFGLPLTWNEFAKNPDPRFPVDDHSYEAYDPESETPLDGIFLAGWAREASSGLVGAARKDGTNGARAVLAYLETAPRSNKNPDLVRLLARQENPVVTNAEWKRLDQLEQEIARERGLKAFKFDTNQEMLAALGLVDEAVEA